MANTPQNAKSHRRVFLKGHGIYGYVGGLGGDPYYGIYDVNESPTARRGFEATLIKSMPEYESLLPKVIKAASKPKLSDELEALTQLCERHRSEGRSDNPALKGSPMKFPPPCKLTYKEGGMEAYLSWKVTPALVKHLTGTTKKVSPIICKLIGGALTEQFGEYDDGYGLSRQLKSWFRSHEPEFEFLEEDYKETYSDPAASWMTPPTESVEISIVPYLLREQFRDHRHPVTPEDIRKCAEYFRDNAWTSEKGGFELLEEAMRKNKVFYTWDDEDYGDDRSDNPALTTGAALAVAFAGSLVGAAVSMLALNKKPPEV